MPLDRAIESAVPADDLYDDATKAYQEVVNRANDPASETVDDKVEGDVVPPSGSDDGKAIARRADGKFAPKVKTEPTARETASVDKADPADAGKPDDKSAADDKAVAKADAKPDDAAAAAATPVAGPPPSWTVKAKAAWDALPEAVRADIQKREGEVANGLAALRDYKDLKPYAEMAQKHGTTIAKSLDRYIGFENVLKQNLGQGLAIIAQNYGYDEEKASKLFAAMATHYSRGKIKMAVDGAAPAPANGQPPASDPLVELLNPLLEPLTKKVSALEGHLTANQRAAHQTQAVEMEKSITQFASDPANVYFPELMDTMVQLMESKAVPSSGNLMADLKAAYDLAARMHPEVSEALIEKRLEADRAAQRKAEQDAADKAKAASRSLSGSRAPGTVVTDAAGHDEQDDLETVVRKAYRMHAQR